MAKKAILITKLNERWRLKEVDSAQRAREQKVEKGEHTIVVEHNLF